MSKHNVKYNSTNICRHFYRQGIPNPIIYFKIMVSLLRSLKFLPRSFLLTYRSYGAFHIPTLIVWQPNFVVASYFYHNQSENHYGKYFTADNFRKFIPIKYLLVSGKIIGEKKIIISKFTLFIFSYFCLDTKVPKNQGKKNSTRSAKQLSGSNKTRHFLLLAWEEMQTTSGFGRTAKRFVIHSTAASAFCPACARAS